jgi:hypothetical protein
MLVLGKNSDDKGTQLEKLTETLLAAKGYRNIARNSIGAGGAEIDVRCDRELPTLSRGKLFRMICECKARKEAVGLTDWLKFCGKIYVDRLTFNSDTLGCFIALSGVNGNVRGNYEELKKHEAPIELITGDDLFALIREHYELLDLRTVLDRVKRITERVVTGSEVLYYEGRVYWLLSFEHDTYTVLTGDGKPLSAEQAPTLRHLVEETQTVTTFISLEDELRARQRARAADTLLVARLMVLGGRATLAAVKESQTQDADDIDAAARRLVRAGVIREEEGGALALTADDAGRVADAYRALFDASCPTTPLGTVWYDEHINRDLLNEIQRIQGGMTLPVSDVATALHVLQLSPTALQYALRPIDLIVNGLAQLKAEVVPETVARGHRDYFFNVLFDSLQADFTRPLLSDYFHTARGIRELELRGAYVIKTDAGVPLRHEYRQRHLYGFIDGFGDRPVLMLALDTQPEPWENPTPPSPAAPKTGE